MLELLVNTEKEHKPVKEVFSRILSAPPTNASNASSNASKPSISTSGAHALSAPLPPQELLVALHQMEDSVELKKSREGRLSSMEWGQLIIAIFLYDFLFMHYSYKNL